jgi:tRNA pseudouridine55 synthase
VTGPDGIVLVDKPGGVTSHDVVDAVRRALGTRKVGHAGTLDPMATGLLVLGVGRATRLLRYLGDLEKTYEGTARLGEETDTLDAEGTVIRTAHVDADRTAVQAGATALVGVSMQRPPAYSAVKVGGRKLYEAARKGEALDAEPRSIVVRSFDVTAFDPPAFDFRVVVSSGTYVRVLVADVGSALGCGAHLTRLVRTQIGPFALRDAVAPERVRRPLPVERAVAHLPSIRIGAEEARVAANGSILGPAGIDGPYTVFGPDGRLIGVYRDDGGKARPEVVLPVG